MNELARRECVPCRSAQAPLGSAELEPLHSLLDPDWQVVDEHHLSRTYRFKNFADALAFTNQVGALAEQVFHHPDIALSWGKVGIVIWTHKIKGLHEADFVFAAKCDQLYQEQS